MRVLIAHVPYRVRGGEDAVVESELGLLQDVAGVDASAVRPKSEEFDALPLGRRLQVALTFPDHALGRALIRDAIANTRPDVVHFHNIYPLLGPGAVREAREQGCGVVQTLHNYRLSCLAGTHLLQGSACERCTPGSFGPGIARACYRGSYAQSVLMARALSRQWADACAGVGAHVSVFLTQHMRDRYVELGLPAPSAVVKANSVDAGVQGARLPGPGALYVGRLSAEKGVQQLVEAWPSDAPPLTVAGGGPLAASVQSRAGDNVAVLGELPPGGIRDLLRETRVLVMPSVWGEGQPLVLLEALAEGVPVVCFEGTAMADVVRPVASQWIVSPMGDFDALARLAAGLALAEDPLPVDALVALHRRTFSHAVNGAQLSAIYEAAAAEAGRGL